MTESGRRNAPISKLPQSVVKFLVGILSFAHEAKKNVTSYSPYPAGNQHPPQKPARRIPIWAWLLIACVSLVGIVCGGGIVGLFVVGMNSPNTEVYLGHQVPEKYLEVARDVAELEDGEDVQYFYSDGFMGIKEGFYYVSDRKVVIYNDDGRSEPLIVVPFDEIETVTLERDESFLIDSEITLELKNGDWVYFPVSSERNRDKKFADEIKKRIRDN